MRTPTNINNVNKTCALLQTTGGKNELNILFMRKSLTKSQHETQNVNTHNCYACVYIKEYNFAHKSEFCERRILAGSVLLIVLVFGVMLCYVCGKDCQ